MPKLDWTELYVLLNINKLSTSIPRHNCRERGTSINLPGATQKNRHCELATLSSDKMAFYLSHPTDSLGNLSRLYIWQSEALF